MSVSAEWVAAGDAFEGEPATLQGAVFPDGLQGVFGTGRRVAARRHGKG